MNRILANFVSLAVVLAVFASCHKTSGPTRETADINAIAEPVSAPGWIKFKTEARVNPKTLFTEHADIFHLPKGNQMVAQTEEKDELGVTHFRFQQFFKEVEVEHAEFRVRAKDGWRFRPTGGWLMISSRPPSRRRCRRNAPGKLCIATSRPSAIFGKIIWPMT